MPADVKKFILKMQGEIKTTKGVSQYSQEKTIYQIIRAYIDLTKNKKEEVT